MIRPVIIFTVLIALSLCDIIPLGFPILTDSKNVWHKLSSIQEIKVYPGLECDRQCMVGELPRVCYFRWVMENYAAMGPACLNCIRGNRSDCFHPQCVTANGVERGIVTINRQIPGPPIVVCKGDTIVVDIVNQMEGLSSTIHWHGFHQIDSPWMDGVPMVTQCPIVPGTQFRYNFGADDPGTQWYHSHSGFQKANGHVGAAIVRNPKDVNIDLYDHDLTEHVILLSDWTVQSVEKWVPGQQSSQMKVDSILINGQGRLYNKSYEPYDQVPLAVFRVQPKKRYRFRLISGGSQYCPFQLQIEKHRMKIISTDGGAVKPRTVDSLISVSGERYDFVLEADQEPGDYWVRVRGIAFCDLQKVEGFAILSYAAPERPTEELMFPLKDPPDYNSLYPLGVVLNNHYAPCYNPDDKFICAADLDSHEVHRDDELIDAEPDKRLFIGFKVIRANNTMLFSRMGVHYVTINATQNAFGTVNNISFTSPSFPLLIQPELITNEQEQFCNDTNLPKYCKKDYCFCTHRLKVGLNEIVEINIYDTAARRQNFYHPYHLHGHRFIITDMGQIPESMLERRLEYLKQRRVYSRRPNSHNPPYKDTISIPNHGFVRTKFRANNPGFWLIHCHFEWHLADGMGLVLQVGETDQMLKAPDDFPRCADFKTKVKGLD
ncbi:uncharacterized protein LOC129746164 isoform X2 [Uranotaenia lowii]|uniref:uncharacterized protein LOC129746164 isoform X2 n=1 Tax=Uranotaenia lowii TaxID=190385 RepID=UPI002478DF1D|nr:uncharacterized protein LOC129746164 isoform X2 [Uranotaenia lowii]